MLGWLNHNRKISHYRFSDHPFINRRRSLMVGDLQRIKLYPARGYQIAQEIPDEVWRAFEGLVRAGYDKYLITN